MPICIGPSLSVSASGQLQVPNPPACKIFHSANQTLVNNTDTLLIFDSEEYDNNNMHDNAVNNSRITFNTAGVYVITCMLDLTAAGDYTDVQARIRLNGSIVSEVDTNTRGTWTNAGLQPTLDLYTHLNFVVGDFIEVRALQKNSLAANRSVLAYTAEQRSPVLAVARLGAG